MGRVALPLLDRLTRSIDRSAGPGQCWPWMLLCDKDGYGKVKVNGKTERVSRLILAEKLGRPIRPGMEACHTCDNPPCSNDAHLYEGSRAENARDMVLRERHPGRQQTHCDAGHEFTPENTIWRPNRTRACRTCHNARRSKGLGRGFRSDLYMEVAMKGSGS